MNRWTLATHASYANTWRVLLQSFRCCQPKTLHCLAANNLWRQQLPTCCPRACCHATHVLLGPHLRRTRLGRSALTTLLP